MKPTASPSRRSTTRRSLNFEDHTIKSARATSTSSPSLLNLRCLDGFRSLAILWMVCFHAWVVTGYMLQYQRTCNILQQQNEEWPTALLFRFISFGSFAVDIMFVLTGVLAAWYLVPELEQAAIDGEKESSIINTRTMRVVLSYWWRRILRAVPAYYPVLLWVAYGHTHPHTRLESTNTDAYYAGEITMANCPNGVVRGLLFGTNWYTNEVCYAISWVRR